MILGFSRSMSIFSTSIVAARFFIVAPVCDVVVDATVEDRFFMIRGLVAVHDIVRAGRRR